MGRCAWGGGDWEEEGGGEGKGGKGEERRGIGRRKGEGIGKRKGEERAVGEGWVWDKDGKERGMTGKEVG